MELGSEASSSLDSTNHVRFRASAPQASWPFSERLTRWTRPITIEILRPHLKTLHRLEIDETLYPNYDQWWVWALEDVIKCDFSVCLFFFFAFRCCSLGVGLNRPELRLWPDDAAGGAHRRAAPSPAHRVGRRRRRQERHPTAPVDALHWQEGPPRGPCFFFFTLIFLFNLWFFFCNPFRGFGGGPVVQDAGLPFWLWVEYVSQSRLMGNQSSFMRRWLGWMSFLSIEFSSIHGCFFWKTNTAKVG